MRISKFVIEPFFDFTELRIGISVNARRKRGFQVWVHIVFFIVYIAWEGWK